MCHGSWSTFTVLYREGLYESIELLSLRQTVKPRKTGIGATKDSGGDLKSKWPDLRGMEFFYDFGAALKLPATH